jgi:hypothetical protein
MAEPEMQDEFAEIEDFCKGNTTEASMLWAEVKAWRQANPGWEEWAMDVRLTRFSLWLGERYRHTPQARGAGGGASAREARLAVGLTGGRDAPGRESCRGPAITPNR